MKLRKCFKCQRAIDKGLWCAVCTHKARLAGMKRYRDALAVHPPHIAFTAANSVYKDFDREQFWQLLEEECSFELDDKATPDGTNAPPEQSEQLHQQDPVPDES